MSIENWLIAFVAVSALAIALFRPLNAQAQLNALDAKMQRTIKQLDDLRINYNLLATQYLLIIGENHWLRAVLRDKGIAIPPLPEDLRPHSDGEGNVTISVRQGGVDVNGGRVDVANDLTGANHS